MINLSEPKTKINRIKIVTMIIVILLGIGSIFFFQSPGVFWGIVTGGCFSLINLWILERIVENLFYQKRPKKAALLWHYVIKTTILLGVLYLLFKYTEINMLAIAVGFSALLIAIAIEGFILPLTKFHLK